MKSKAIYLTFLIFLSSSIINANEKLNTDLNDQNSDCKNVTRDTVQEKSFSNATHLKTGRLKNVFALSGFMKSSKGEDYIVTFVLNGPQYQSFLKFIEQSLDYLYQH